MKPKATHNQGRVQAGVLLILLVLISFYVLAQVYAKQRSGNSGLTLTVGEQQSLTVVGNNVIMKIRLLPGVTAKIWGDNPCGAPIKKAMAITSSGTYTLPLANLPHQNRVYVCLASSDGKLNASVPWPPVHSDN